MIPDPAATATYVLRASGSSVVVNRPAGVITSSSSPTRSRSSTPSLKAPPGSRLTPILSTPEDGGSADRVAASYVVAAADVQVLAVDERVVVGELRRHVEGDRDGVVGQLVDGRDPQGVERGPVPAHQIFLKWSNGSRQDRQTHSDLQAVEPNRLDSRVSGLPHCGQRTVRASGTGPSSGAAGRGDAVRRQLAAASSVIQSVVQAGARTNSTATCW